MLAPLGAYLRQDTGPHPAFTCMACPATVQTAAERFCLFCSDNVFLFSSAAFAPHFARICFRGPAKAFWCRRLCPLASYLQVMPPGRARGLRKLWKGILPASLSRGAECSVPCIICPASCKRSSSRCVLHPLGIEYHPASLETDSESLFTRPGTAAGCRFAKTGQSRRAAPSAGASRFIVS